MADDETPDFDINPDDFSGQEALVDLAKMGLTVFRAVLRDDGTWNEAFTVTAAFFAGMSKGAAKDE